MTNVNDAINHWRYVLRETEYLNGQHKELVSITGKPLNEDLLQFTHKASTKILYNISTEML